MFGVTEFKIIIADQLLQQIGGGLFFDFPFRKTILIREACLQVQQPQTLVVADVADLKHRPDFGNTNLKLIFVIL